MKTYYDFVFEKNGYFQQYLNTYYAFYYKDAGEKYKAVLLINNHGRNNIVAKKNLIMLETQISQLPCFLYKKKIEFLVILFHAGRKDRVRFQDENLILFGADYQDKYYHITETFRDEVKALQMYRMESRRGERYYNRAIRKDREGYPIVSILLSLICIAVYMKGINQIDYGLSVSNIAKGKYITLLTYAFLHAGLLHLIGNIISLLVLGSMLEKQLGNLRYLLFIMAAVIYTGALTIGYKVITGSDITTVGISGVIYAIMGCFLIARLANKQRCQFVLTYTLVCLLKGALMPSVDTAIHVLGLLTGMLFAVILLVINQLIEQEKYSQYRKAYIAKQMYKSTV